MSKKRFIAGAKCPKCQQMDKIAIITQDSDEHVECVACGFVQQKPKSLTPPVPGSGVIRPYVKKRQNK